VGGATARPSRAERPGAILEPVSDALDPQPERAPAPLPRIGDAERDRAVDALQVHMAQGRLDRDEFDERLGRALNARTAADLQPLFDDLPEPRPSTGLVAAYDPPPWNQATPAADSSPVVVPDSSVPAPRSTPLAANIVLALVWPAAVLLCIATGWDNWWWFIVAGMVAAVVRRSFPGSAETPEAQRGPTDGPQH